MSLDVDVVEAVGVDTVAVETAVVDIADNISYWLSSQLMLTREIRP